MTLVRVRKGPPGSDVATGVVVAPTVVITSAHVLNREGEIAVADSETPASVAFDGRTHDPSRDIAVLETSEALPNAASPLTFFHTRRRDASLVAAGFWRDPIQLNPRSARVAWIGDAGVDGLLQFTTTEGDPKLMVGMSGGCIHLEVGTNPPPVVRISSIENATKRFIAAAGSCPSMS